MTNRTIWVLAGSAFALVMLGALAGAALYATLFDTPAYLPAPGGVPAAFSRFAPEQTSAVAEGGAASELPAFTQAAMTARPAVVHIKAHYKPRKRQDDDFFANPFRDYFEEDPHEAPQGVASGSGVLISADGYIATNNHVIQDAEELEITLFDNRSFKGRVIGTDLSTDLALVKIEGSGFPALAFGNSDEVQVGQWVLAVGNPMDLTSTVTAGIVSAKGRNINLLHADTEFAIESFIQTDAAVNKGNSGGALVDMEGRLVGINTAIASRTGYYAGYSFAIPATIVRRVMEDLLEYGEVRRGFLGVTIQAVDAALAEQEGLNVLKGAYISRIDGKLGAAEAGMRQGDVIVSVNGIDVASAAELQEQVNRYRPGESVRIRAYRGKDVRDFSVMLKDMKSGPLLAAESPETFEYRGATFRSLTSDELRRLDIAGGVLVEQPGETLVRGGVQKGFVITDVNGGAIRTPAELEAALESAGEYMTMKGLYRRGVAASYSFNW